METDSTLPLIANVVLTGLLTLITGAYAWLTYKIMQSNKAMVDAAARERYLAYRPYIQPMLTSHPENSQVLLLQIHNLGRSAAVNLRISIDRDFFSFCNPKDERNLTNYPLFNDVISSFPPNYSISFYLGGSHQIFEDKNKHLTPQQFTISTEYYFDNIKIMESFPIDLTHLDHSANLSDPIAKNIGKVALELQNVKKQISDLNRSISKLTDFISKEDSD